MLLNIITDLLKKALSSHDKNKQRVYNICCSGKNTDLLWKKWKMKNKIEKKEEKICWKKKIVICLRTKHLGVLKNSLKRVRGFQIELEFGIVVF